MASSFMGLYVQRDGLNLAQKALDITGSNITNVKTPGYTRQRLDIVSTKNDNRTLGYVNQVFLAGAGADGKGVTQIRDELLDNQFRKYSSITSGLTVKQNVLSDVEDAIDDIENDESGFASALKNFKSAFQSFSANGTDQSDLASVAQNQAQTMIDVLRTFSNRIDSVSEDVISDAKSTVSRVNDILEQCAKLNEQIKYSYVNMNNIYESGTRVIADTTYGPLELKDSMNNLIDELSNYMKVSVKTEEDGTFTISLPNEAKTTLVKLDKYAKMDIATDPAKVTVDTVQDETGKDVLDITIPDPEPGELKFQFSELRTAKSWKNVRCEYKDTVMDVSLNGAKLTGCGTDGLDPADSNNIIQLTFDAAYAVRNGDLESANRLIDKLQKAQTTVLEGITRMGATQNKIDFYLNKNEDYRYNLSEDQNETEGVKIEKEITNMTAAQAAYNAALQLGARAIPQSIFSYI